MSQSNSNNQQAESSNNAGKKSNRGQNWSVAEDEQLCMSWIAISTDPIVGRDQKHSVLWMRIKIDFDLNLTEKVTERSQVALISRWNTIQAKVSKFCGFLEQVKNLNQSGVNADAMVTII